MKVFELLMKHISYIVIHTYRGLRQISRTGWTKPKLTIRVGSIIMMRMLQWDRGMPAPSDTEPTSTMIIINHSLPILNDLYEK